MLLRTRPGSSTVIQHALTEAGEAHTMQARGWFEDGTLSVSVSSPSGKTLAARLELSIVMGQLILTVADETKLMSTPDTLVLADVAHFQEEL